MFSFFKRILFFIEKKVITKFFFNIYTRERIGRQEFFYNAFKVLSFNGIDGDYVEFGSHGGKTFDLSFIESRRHKHKAKLWAFDSFQGLPSPEGVKDEHPVWSEGAMKTTLDQFHAICASKGIPVESYNVVPGFYDQILPTLSPKDEPTNIALTYIDCDLYSSTKTVIEFLFPRLKHGMIIAFDDYFCYSKSQVSGERKAMLEFFSENDRWELVPYMQFGWHGQSFIVEDMKSIDNI